MKDISMKELEVRQMLLPSLNWEYMGEAGQNAKKQNMVFARCGVCGHEQKIPKSLFFRKHCAVPCPGCRQKLVEKATGLEIDKYKIRFVNFDSDPLTCIIECMDCGRIYYDVRVDFLVLRRYKAELCSYKRYPKKDIPVVYFKGENK